MVSANFVAFVFMFFLLTLAQLIRSSQIEFIDTWNGTHQVSPIVDNGTAFNQTAVNVTENGADANDTLLEVVDETGLGFLKKKSKPPKLRPQPKPKNKAKSKVRPPKPPKPPKKQPKPKPKKGASKDKFKEKNKNRYEKKGKRKQKKKAREGYQRGYNHDDFGDRYVDSATGRRRPSVGSFMSGAVPGIAGLIGGKRAVEETEDMYDENGNPVEYAPPNLRPRSRKKEEFSILGMGTTGSVFFILMIGVVFCAFPVLAYMHLQKQRRRRRRGGSSESEESSSTAVSRRRPGRERKRWRMPTVILKRLRKPRTKKRPAPKSTLSALTESTQTTTAAESTMTASVRMPVKKKKAAKEKKRKGAKKTAATKKSSSKASNVEAGRAVPAKKVAKKSPAKGKKAEIKKGAKKGAKGKR